MPGPASGETLRLVAQALTAVWEDERAPGTESTVALLRPVPDIQPPPPQAGLVGRERLVRRLIQSQGRPVALVIAPAGYGKTTLLAEWAARDARPFARVTLTRAHRDRLELLSAIAAALESIEPLGWEVFEALTSGRHDAADVALQRLVRVLDKRARPVVLAIDDLHVLPARAVWPVLETVGQALGPGSQIAVAARGDAGLPVGRLRTHRSSIELRSADLAMTRSEAAALLRAAGVAPEPDEVLALVQRTGGWPAGLYLAALSLSDQGPGARAEAFSGDDRYVADYVNEELLAGLPPRRREFLVRTSILERLSAPLCDAVLERSGSADELEALTHTGLPLEVLDRNRAGYRYNPLFADVLRSELSRADPDRAACLHRRASNRLGAEGDTDGALVHAIQAADLPRAGRLLWGCAIERLAQGREESIRSALACFSDEQLSDTPLLALTAAAGSLARGALDEAERWTSVAAAGRGAQRPAGRRNPVDAGVALMRAWTGRDGVGQMGADAARADALLEPKSPWRALCGLLRGISLQLGGEPEEARLELETAGHRAASRAPMIQALCLAQLALASAEAGDTERAAVLVARARAQVERSELSDSPTVALVFSVSAALRAQTGTSVEAAADLRHARELLARVTDPTPWYDAECRILLADAAARTGVPAAAAQLLTEAQVALRRCPDAGVLEAMLVNAQDLIERSACEDAAAEWSLTAAELRVLGYLPSHLCFREIADRLYVSSNTVKTHARAIYRKLGVSSRGEAVELARGAALVEPEAAG